MIILIWSEFYFLFFGEPLKSQFVNNSHIDERIRVNLNISFHSITCQAISIDYQDVTGTHLEDIHHSLYKIRLDPNGNTINLQ
jgi:hypothetical protein